MTAMWEACAICISTHPPAGRLTNTLLQAVDDHLVVLMLLVLNSSCRPGLAPADVIFCGAWALADRWHELAATWFRSGHEHVRRHVTSTGFV